MLTSISIENFRCFEKAEFSGFSLINVLGGENNAGKTALLEAIYLACANKGDDAITEVFKFRKFEIAKFNLYLKEKIFENLFWNQNKYKTIRINRKNAEIENKLEIKYNSGAKMEGLAVETGTNNLLSVEDFAIITPNPVATINENEEAYKVYRQSPIYFLPTQYDITKFDLVLAYEELEYNRKESVLLNAFQIIDPNIEKIKTFSSNPLSLHLARKGESYMPINFFGDAMNKIAYCILHIIKAAKGILLIDEIENGIHHDHQRDFWRALLLLAKEYEVQIFATSHSLEMIRAYNDVAMELETTKTEFADVCHYFEMARHAKTQQITAIKMNMNMLHRKIVKNNPFRGE